MTQEVDILSTRASDLAEEIRSYLATKFTIAARVREVAAGRGFRIFQNREPKNRDLVHVRQVAEFPPTQIISEVRVPSPEELIAQKVISFSARSAQPEGGTDRRDLKVLLLAYPHLKMASGPVRDRLSASVATAAALAEWEILVVFKIERECDFGEY
jgi:hypothetical protein